MLLEPGRDLGVERLGELALVQLTDEVELEGDERRDLALGVPSFRSATTALCGADDVQAVLTGRVVDADGLPVGGATVAARWETPNLTGPTAMSDFVMTTGDDGRYRVCGAPGEARVELSVEVDGDWTQVLAVVIPERAFTYRELRLRR